ncbi:hypothetical protein [Cryobacterium arcticum]|uniref:Uncharacterized protein n=1 Tax=Cryobacterium arcticum TaxID=670052 RepID=A0A1B1BLT9_9MICO|nr:hypothetical protein [Cryobacterium arcticum]ANP73484.1 hypothetical protein PA27867_2536 [Cryobacterium arcticum]
MTDNTAQQAQHLAEDAADKATDLAEQARHAIDDTVSTVKSAVNDLDLDKTADTVIATAHETLDKITAAYKRNPALVLTIASVALAIVGTIVSRRR